MQFAGQDLVAVVAIAPRTANHAAPMVAAKEVATPAARAAAVAGVVVLVATRVAVRVEA